MKQLFLILSVFALVFGMTSCGAGYDLDKCKTLQEKIDNGDELTQEDYADIIGQAKALCGFLENKVKGYADLESLKEAEEYKKVLCGRGRLLWPVYAHAKECRPRREQCKGIRRAKRS